MKFALSPRWPLRAGHPAVARLAVVMALALAAAPARADVVLTVQALQIVDRGKHLVLNWGVNYADLPAQFTLKEKQSETIDLNDPAALYQNLSDIVSVAFDLRINGKPVEPERIISLTVAPNKLCTAKVLYHGVPGGHLEIRAPVLQYLPDTYVINYNIYSLTQPGKAVTGNLIKQDGDFSKAIHYEEVAGDGGLFSMGDTATLEAFKSSLRTAWINPNWLFIGVILLLVQTPKRVVVLMSILAFEWILICLLRVEGNVTFPWAVPGLFLSCFTVLLGVVAGNYPQAYGRLALIAGTAGVLNACYDLQQIRWTAENETRSALFGLSLGFICGVALTLIVLIPLLAECRRFHEFEKQWAPKLCWMIAAAAILLPLQTWVFH